MERVWSVGTVEEYNCAGAARVLRRLLMPIVAHGYARVKCETVNRIGKRKILKPTGKLGNNIIISAFDYYRGSDESGNSENGEKGEAKSRTISKATIPVNI